MDLVSFSIRTKGLPNFTRRLWTIFVRFGFSEAKTRAGLRSIVECVREHDAVPTFFIPAVVLQRHPTLIHEIAAEGAEIGIHGYVHNDYRTLTRDEQLAQTDRAIGVFEQVEMPFEGFRNPYLGWTDDAVAIFEELGFVYDSNEAVLHDVIRPDALPTKLRGGYLKSPDLFQAIPCSAYTLRPHVEGKLVRIPTSIPDDEMLYDRLRITDPLAVGRLWRTVMRRVYAYGGVYVLNLHPERGVLCRDAVASLLDGAQTLPLPVWVAPLHDMAAWWRERLDFRLSVTPLDTGEWRVEAEHTPRGAILARNVRVEGAESAPWHGPDRLVSGAAHFTVHSPRCPAVAVAPDTPWEVVAFLREQGYPCVTATTDAADAYAAYVELPDGLGETREERMRRGMALVERIERADTPLVRFGLWPRGYQAALAITGDIDSVTIQDFFRRVVEVRSPNGEAALPAQHPAYRHRHAAASGPRDDKAAGDSSTRGMRPTPPSHRGSRP